jgi:signal transduction histidine kinase
VVDPDVVDRLEAPIRAAFAAETRRIMVRRVPLGIAFFVATVVVAGLIEWRHAPERLPALVESFTVEMLLCGLGFVVSRHPRLRDYVIPVTSTATLGVVACMTLYTAASGTSADALAFALVLLLPGVVPLYPWGAAGQVPLAIGTVIAYAFALLAGVRGDLPLPYGIFAVIGAALVSVFGAISLDQLRQAVFQQRVLLERRRDAQMATLFEVTRTVAESLELHQVVDLVCDSILGALRIERLWLVWRETADGDLHALEARREGLRVATTVIPGDAAAWEALVAASAEAGVAVREAGPDEEGLLGGVRPLAGPLLRLPLHFRSERIGLLLAERARADRMPDPSFLDFAATLGNSAAMAIANARLHAVVVRNRTELQRLSKRGLAFIESVMRRIAHELHDNTCQTLMAIKLDLATLERRMDGPSPALRDAVRDIASHVTRVLHDVREMSHLIRPPVLDEFGAVAAIESVAGKYRDATGLLIDIECEEPGTRYPAEVELLLLRIFQEAMMNVIKHAGATRVRVAVTCGAQAVELAIADDGRGFDAQSYFRHPPSSAGLGLLGMRERVGYFGGTLELTSQPGRGTTILTRVPVAAATAVAEAASG